MQLPYSVPLTGAQAMLGPFPFDPAGMTLVNSTGKTLTVTDDRGIAYVAAAHTIVSGIPSPTTRLLVKLSGAAAAGESATVYVSSDPVPITSSALAAVATGGSAIQRVSALPATPADLDVVEWHPDSVAWPGVAWLLMFDATSGYWEFVGGAPIYLNFPGGGAIGVAGAWTKMSNALLLPKEGTWRIEWGVGLYSAGVAGVEEQMQGAIRATPDVAAHTALGGRSQAGVSTGTSNANNRGADTSSQFVGAFVPAGSGLQTEFWALANNAGSFIQSFWELATPVRIK